ncbi:MAG: phage head morphogenesis protein [Treponema sp.]|nr:phage head morphogenesis protein [Treponema sp.]
MREERNAARLDRMEVPYRRIITQSLLRRVRAWFKELEHNPGLLDDDTAVLPEDYKTLNAIHELLMKACLMGMDAAGRERDRLGDSFADDPLRLPDMPVGVLPYEEAVRFLTTQIPLDRKAYYDLDDKLRLRAFTVGRLNDGDAVNRVKGIIRTNLEKGGTIADFYAMTDDEILDGLGFGKGNMSYWETVYRTNEATVHNAGRAMDFENVPPAALELVGIRDVRQSDICYELTKQPFIRPYNDPVWQTLWPPFHFNCRTTVRGIYDIAELDEYGGAEAAYKLGTKAEPQEGFGGYPLDKESYWRLTPEMSERAKLYGIDGELVVAAKNLGMENYALELMKDYKTIYTPASGDGYVKQALNSIHTKREIGLAKKAADDGHQLYLLPESPVRHMKNPDIIIDNDVGDIKQIKSSVPARIDDAVKDAGHKGATTVLLEAPPSIPEDAILFWVQDRMKHSIVNKVIVYWNEKHFIVQ